MKRMACLVAVVAVTSGGTLTAQFRGANLSGTWTAPGSSLTIQQDASVLTVSNGTDSRTYNLDGSDSRAAKNGTQYTARVRWVGSALVIATVTVSSIGTWEDLRVLSIDYGPKLSVVDVESQMTQGVMHTLSLIHI